MRPNKKLKSSEFTYHKKDANTYMSACDRVLNALKKLDTLYNLTMPIMHESVLEGEYKLTGNTMVIMIVVEHEGDEIQWA